MILFYRFLLFLNTLNRLWATGVDGTAVPISLVYRRDLLNQNSQEATSGNPLLLNGYGAYGCCVQPLFNAARLSLIDRGFVFAVAHVRGGSDMGNGWYDTGKLAKKPNTFHDFISCAEFLIQVCVFACMSQFIYWS